MISGLKSIRRGRAALEHARVVIGSMIEDNIINESFSEMNENFFENVTDEEIEELIAKLPECEEEDAEVERIMKSDTDLTVDEIIGVEEEV